MTKETKKPLTEREKVERDIAGLNESIRLNWLDLARGLFDSVLQEGGVWHLYGHSWEIEEFDLWDDLKQILEYVSGRDGVLYLSNGEALGLQRANGARSHQK